MESSGATSLGRPLHLKPDSRPGESPAAGGPGMGPPSSPGSASDTFDAELRLIAEQAQMLTLASGAAIALRQGELMLCYARAGDGAPALGAQLDTQSGLSGECVRTARTLLCEDTENDPRVNLDVCRYLGIRSIAVLPICLDREVVGVFEAFSAHPGAFSANEMAALESMRDLVISVIRPQPPAEVPGPSALGAIIAADELPLTPLRRPETHSPPAPLHPVRSWPLETSRPDQSIAPPARTTEPAPPVFQQQEAAPFRPIATVPSRGPFQPAISPELEDDLICELEQRESDAPQSEAESLKRAFQLFDASSAQPAPPRTPLPPSSPVLPRSFAPPAAPDPDDDLICEIEARSIPPAPMEVEPHPAHANAFSAFTPAPVRPPEHQVSRKLIVAGVVVALSGLLWLRWCNHTQQVKGPARPASTVQAAVPPAPPAAPSSQPSAASGASTAPASSTASAAGAADTAALEGKSKNAEEASDSPQPQPEAPPPQAARQHRAPASVLGGQKRLPARPQTQPHERAALEKTGPLLAAPSTSYATLASPPPNAGQPAPRAFTAPPAEQLRAAAVPANPPPQASPPPFTLKPAPAPAVPPPPTGQLSLSQAVVKSSSESSAADTLSPDALRLLLDSAQAGDAGAQLALAMRYANGDGVRQSYPEAFKWFTRAQAQGAVPRQGQAAQVWSKVQQWAQSHPQKK